MQTRSEAHGCFRPTSLRARASYITMQDVDLARLEIEYLALGFVLTSKCMNVKEVSRRQ